MEYTVLEFVFVKNFEGLDFFVKAVNNKIAEGWVPLGGITASENNGVKSFFQAMTRTK